MFPNKSLKQARFCLVAPLAAAWAFTAQAHHSGAAYDEEHALTFKGTVKSVNWTNPHITFHVDADAADGKPAAEWVFEVSSPGVLTRSGWTKHSLNPGDHAEFRIAPLRDGTFGGRLIKVTQPDGKVLTYTLVPPDQE